MLNELFLKNRSYRRFSNKRRVKTEELRLMIESARLAASGANRQRIRYALVNDKNECDRIFSELKFAAYLKDWQGPTEEERPTAYVIFMTESENLDTVLAIDFGIAAEA
ncbi:MAG: nitroreductase family protein, partial [Clostridia bacterium]|nr:nitroreductase family protein [Clostridia bacterium]